MSTGRVEAFSDGVIAILITIMVLEFKVPASADLAALRPLVPVFLTYVLSFVVVGIYWNNHHHLLRAAEHVDGRVLWANLHLLFWLSLVPFVTNWMGDNPTDALPTAVYGIVLILAACAYTILQTTIIRAEGPHSRLASMVRSDVKGKLSIAMYAFAIVFAFVNHWIAQGLYAAVAIIWFVPDRRIERQLTHV
jgi:uncharacterized membrane protein